MKTLILAIALLGILGSTSGCAVLLTGYLVGDAMQKNKATETCRANLTATNNARVAKGQDVLPDMCAH